MLFNMEIVTNNDVVFKNELLLVTRNYLVLFYMDFDHTIFSSYVILTFFGTLRINIVRLK
jgi:hypothetical protein